MFSKTTKRYINTFTRLALAVSGGRDSMALLWTFIANKNELCDFVVINVNHNLRGEEGIRDSEFVKSFCDKHNVQCFCFDEDIRSFCLSRGLSIEHGARIRRKEIFELFISQEKAQRVLTAHHADDQAESILMHIFRGSGINGLCGMSLDDGVLIRPFLEITRSHIDKYISQNNIPFVEDSTNTSNEYSRNKLRNDILPEIQKIYGGAIENINKLGQIANQVKILVDKQCPSIQTNGKVTKLEIAKISNNPIVQAEIIAKALDSISTRVDLTSKHINAVIGLINGKNAKKISLPYGIEVSKEYDYLTFFKKDKENYELNNKTFTLKKDKPAQSFENKSLSKDKATKGQIFSLARYGQFDCGQWQLQISEHDNGGLRCDYDCIVGQQLRTRQNGDRFSKFGGGTKSLGDFFTDKKIAKRLRDNIIVIANDKDILMVLPYEISNQIAISQNTKRIAYAKAILKENK